MQNINQKIRKIKLSALIFILCLFPSLGFGNPVILQEIAEIESAIEKIQSEELSASNRIISFEVERPIVALELNSLKAQLVQLEDQLTSYETDLASLELNATDVSKQYIKTQSEADLTQADKASLVSDIAKLVTTVRDADSQITLLANNLQSLEASYIESTTASNQQLNGLLALKGRFEELVALWEKRVGEIIDHYQQRKAVATTDAQKGVIDRYIATLNNLLNRYRSVFTGMYKLYDSRIAQLQTNIDNIKNNHLVLVAENEKQVSIFKTVIEQSETELTAKRSLFNEKENLLNSLNQQLISLKANQTELEEKISSLVTLAEQLENTQRTVSTDVNELETKLASIINEISILVVFIEDSVTKKNQLLEEIAELILSLEPELSREDKIEIAKQAIEHIEQVDSGSCRLSPMLGTLVACFMADKQGIIRISHEDLMEVGVDLRGTPKQSIGILSTDITNIPMYVSATDLFEEDSYIEVATQGYDSIYTDSRMYQIFVNFDESVSTVVSNKTMRVVDNANASLSTQVLIRDNNEKFSNIMRLDGGFYDPAGFTYLFPNKTGKLSFDFNLDQYVDLNEIAELHFNFGHSLTRKDILNLDVTVNDIAINTDFGELNGYGDVEASFNVPANTLSYGKNTLNFIVSKSGPSLRGAIEIDGFKIDLKRKTILEDTPLVVKYAQGAGRAGEFILESASTPVIYTIDRGGRVSRHSITEADTVSGDKYLLNDVFNSSLIAQSNLDKVQLLSPAKYSKLPTEKTEYLIVSHNDFIGSQALNDLVALRSGEYQVSVVDVDQIYAEYNAGTFDAFAIQDYLKEMVNAGVKMVLMVGDDYYDYKKILGGEGKSFIPSMLYSYPKTGPSDSRYVDVDEDKVPDAAIGRMPVENVEELRNIVDKTIAYENHSYSNTALMATNHTGGLGSFYHEIIKKRFPYNSSYGYGYNWDIDEVLLNPASKLINKEIVDNARPQIYESLNDGASLTIYTGHNDIASGHLLNDSHLSELTNVLKPTVLFSLDSYTGRYFQDSVGQYSSVKAESILVEKDVGAAAVIATASLTGIGQYQMEMLRNLIADKPIGEAHREAFYWAAGTERAFYNVLGDPALRLKAVQ